MSSSATTTTTRPLHISAIIFPGFQLLDLTGPLDALNFLSLTHPLTISILARTLSPVSTLTSDQAATGSTFSQSLLPTHTFDSAPAYADVDVVLLPGGGGKSNEDEIQALVSWLAGWLEEGGDGKGEKKKKWVITVCTGSAILARTGVLNGRRATTNKKAFNRVKAQHPAVNWVPKARWVVDGNIWTSSGISAGIDVMFAWIAEVYGEDVAKSIADRSEYERNLDSEKDRFAEIWGAE